jgi:hypothetical protein
MKNRTMSSKRTTGPSPQRVLCITVATEPGCSAKGCKRHGTVSYSIDGTVRRYCPDHVQRLTQTLDRKDTRKELAWLRHFAR